MINNIFKITLMLSSTVIFAQTNSKDSIVVGRNPIGDINAEQVSKAEIPGAAVVSRSKYGVLAIGGFFKTLGIVDTKSEMKLDASMPGYLGIPGVDAAQQGQSYIDARATRITLTALTDVEGLKLKGYVEWNFRGEPTNFSFRLAYLTVTTKSGKTEFLAGKYFSNIGDVYSVPDALSEPTVSGLMVNERQEQFKWTQVLSPSFKFSTSVENAPNADVLGSEIKNRIAPTITTNLSWVHPQFKTHFFIGGLLRNFWLTDKNDVEYKKSGWALSAGTHYSFSPKTKLQYVFSTGEGIGNYMVGADPLAAGIIIPNDKLSLRKSMGHYLALQHKWNDVLRSNVMSGMVILDNRTDYPSIFTYKSTQLGINTMWKIKKFLTVGVEYWYGTREDLSGKKWDNQRFVFGVQLF